MAVPGTIISLAERRPVASQDTCGRGDHDTLLAEAFLRASRSGRAEIVAVNEHLLMSTSGAAQFVTVMDQTSLWRWACTRGIAGPALLHLEGRAPTRARCVPVVDGAELAGILVELGSTTPVLSVSRDQDRFVSVLPGMSRQATALRAQLARAAHDGSPTVISGEVGSGRSSVGRRLLDPDESGQPLLEFDATDIADGRWGQRVSGTLRRSRVLLTHLDELPIGVLATVLEAVERAGPGCRAVATVGTSSSAEAIRQAFPVHIELPPLRERFEDLPAIAAHILAGQPGDGSAKRLDPGVRRQLWSYHWPGNVAELEHVLRQAALRAPTPVVDESCLRMPGGGTGGLGARRRTLVAAAETDVLLDALERCGGNKLAAAAMLGISRSTLYRKVQALGVSTT